MAARRVSHVVTLVAVATLGSGFAMAAPPARTAAPHGDDVAVAYLMQRWQQRILSEALPVEDPANWARRNLARFSRLSPERVALAERAATLGELEVLLMDAPVPAGSRLGLVLASQPDITLATGAQAKSTPADSPSSYADLVFTALTPCRIYDSRIGYGGPGVWLGMSTNTFSIGPNASYAFQGGSSSDCGMTTTLGTRKIAAIMAAVSTTGQVGAGYLTFFSAGATNPFPYGVSQAYQPGTVQTSFVIIPTDVAVNALASGYTSVRTHVIIDVVGYFAAPNVTASGTRAIIVDNIDLVNSTATAGNILKEGVRFIHNYGAYNTFVGELAGSFATGGLGANTAVGFGALGAITSGYDNVAVGKSALAGVTGGWGNTGIGVGAGSLITTGNLNIAIGHPGAAGESGTVRIGLAGTHMKTYIAGIRGVTTDVADGVPLVVSSEGQLGTISSSRRNKADIADMYDVRGTLMKLRPVTFHYKGDRNPRGPILQYGLIAEEVAAVDPGLVARSRDGEAETVLYQFLPPMLLDAFKRQRQTIEAQAAKITSLEARAAKVEAFEAELAALKARLGSAEAP